MHQLGLFKAYTEDAFGHRDKCGFAPLEGAFSKLSIYNVALGPPCIRKTSRLALPVSRSPLSRLTFVPGQAEQHKNNK